jgi:hypothetical protein
MSPGLDVSGELPRKDNVFCSHSSHFRPVARVRVQLDRGSARMLDHAIRDYPLDDEFSAIVGSRSIASAREDDVPAGGNEETIRNPRNPGEPAAGHDDAAGREPQQNEGPSGLDADRTRHRPRNTQFLVNVEVTVIAE